MDEDKIIYHYCSADSLLKIINSKSLFLTSTKTMNDSLELVWGGRLFFDLLKERIKNGEDKKNIDILYKHITFCLMHKYISCFSGAKDSLSQWRAYADDGRGVAIGFSIKNMKIDRLLAEPTISDNDDRSLGLCSVIYNKDKQVNFINQIIDDYITHKDLERITYLSQFLTMFKNPAFQEECEWRLVHSPLTLSVGYNSRVILGKISECKFRMTNFGISPYFEWSFTNHDPHPIKEVILGPQHRSDPDDIDFFLNYNGFKDVTIKVSSASYRS